MMKLTTICGAGDILTETERTVDMPIPMLLGADVGATHTRLALEGVRDPHAARAHECEGSSAIRVDGAGFNVRSSGPDALDHFEQTLARAFAQLESGSILEKAVFGISGAGPARHERIEALVREAVVSQATAHHLQVDPANVRVVDDLCTAFASAFPASPSRPTGVLVLAGTGAASVSYVRGVESVRRDGMGWFLGDIGSAVWLGKRALEATAADLDARGPATALTGRICEELGFHPRENAASLDPRQALIREVYDLAPAEYGRFAPIVTELGHLGEGEGDQVAREIVAEAIESLLEGALALAKPLRGESPVCVVLAGGVLTSRGPIGDLVRYALEREGFDVREAASPLDGALALARAESRL